MPCATPRALPLCARLFLYCLVCCPFIPSVAPLSFNITSFDTDLRDILYEGVATATYGYVDLTTGNPHHYQVGRIKYANPIRIWDPLTGRQADFSTNFSFIIETYGSAQYSDGLAFFLAPVGIQIPPNSAGGFLGLFNASTANEGHRNHIVMVEFDTFVNPEFDPPMHHIGINENHLKSLVYKPWDPALHSGKAILVLVTYNSTSKNLTVLWSFDGKPPSQDKTYPSLSWSIDLASVLPESVEIGFSASFGYHPERHSINSWEFTSNLDVVDPLPPDRSPPKGVNSKPRRLRILVVVPVACFLLVISAGSCFFAVKRSEKHGYGTLTDIDKEIGALPKKFTYQELLAATNGFADDRRLGRGGSGQVYKGFLRHSDRLVAVKRIFAESRHSEKVFVNEVKIISRTIHRNLVPFVGWCQEEGEFLLVYEYMPNGSLDHHLFGARRSLPWDVRYNVALGLASALNYLHEELEQCVLHRDIKAANVLLDTNFSTKLGDFGVAKLVDPRFRTQTTEVVGTCGYLAPEYFNGGKATKESDMFSFGVVALEIACGRRSYEDREIQVLLHKWVWQLYLAGNILGAADEAMCSGFRREEVECLMMVGLWCVHPDPARRPRAGQVIRFLRLEDSVPELLRGAFDGPVSYRPSASQLGMMESPSAPIPESVSIK
ncbi:L-type lectin-domain containing receptor kinase IX.1-like [Syzygium oleosum]|uniref:L-type lectin-domain containing receptor kinase IX.1-like n=1 Tax=Syzygium oleosum TaxID=219896 RepID=UPI0024BA2721|nr:L-type lectin-domain containing receptor kinase IX.1-like [Syzygium oleosum]